jgi:hypothetical protein
MEKLKGAGYGGPTTKDVRIRKIVCVCTLFSPDFRVVTLWAARPPRFDSTENIVAKKDMEAYGRLMDILVMQTQTEAAVRIFHHHFRSPPVASTRVGSQIRVPISRYPRIEGRFDRSSGPE